MMGGHRQFSFFAVMVVIAGFLMLINFNMIGMDSFGENGLTGQIISVSETAPESELGIQAETNCNPPTDALWTVNNTVVCENRPINISALSISSDQELSVTSFSTSNTAIYDLRGNSSTLTAEIPDLDPSTPTEYTADWDADANQEFRIAMNESEHSFTTYINNTDAGLKLYFFDIDNNKATGCDGTGMCGPAGSGTDLAIGYYTSIVTEFVACWNSTAGNWYNALAVDGSSGSKLCDTALTGGDVDFTMYWINSGHNTEIMVDVDGAWIDKDTYYFTGPSTKYTTFKNSSAEINSVGNLTLTNVSLNISGNLDLGTGTTFTLSNSNLVFGLSNNGSANFTANAESNLNLNGNTITGNSSYHWGFKLATNNFEIQNNNISYAGDISDSDVSYDTTITAGTSGLIYNNNFTSCRTCLRFNCNALTCSGLNVSSNYATSLADRSSMIVNDVAGLEFTDNNVYQIRIYSGDTSNYYFNNNLTHQLTLTDEGDYDNNTFINTQFTGDPQIDPFLKDENITTYNTFIYDNDYGNITWSEKSNFTLGTLPLKFGSDASGTEQLIIADNYIYFNMSANYSNFNTSATLVFKNLTYVSTPYLLKDGVRCDNTSACNITYDQNTKLLTAVVSSFSNYTASGTTEITPNSTISASVDMLNNLSCNGTCINLGASDIYIDCHGHYINYSQDGNLGYGIHGAQSGNYNNITIRNCLFYEGNATTNDKHGIYLEANNDSVIYNNTFVMLGGHSNAIRMADVSKNINITSNTITSYGTASNLVIHTNDNSIIDSNTITCYGDTSVLINVDSRSNLTVTSNMLYTYCDSCYAISYISGSNDSLFSGNVILNNGTSNLGFIVSSATNGTFRDNSLTNYGSNSSGFYLVGTSAGNVFLNNNISTGYTLGINDISSSTTNNTLIYNNTYGEINWTKGNLTSGIGLIVGTTIYLANNTVGLVDTPDPLALNGSAQIIIKNVSYSTTPYLLKNGVRCDNTDLCNVSYDSTTHDLSANVSSFSNYTTSLTTSVTTPTSSSSSSSSSSGGGSSSTWGYCGDGVCNDGLTCAPDENTNENYGPCYHDCGLCPAVSETESSTSSTEEPTSIEDKGLAEVETVPEESKDALVGQAMSSFNKVFTDLSLFWIILIVLIVIVAVLFYLKYKKQYL